VQDTHCAGRLRLLWWYMRYAQCLPQGRSVAACLYRVREREGRENTIFARDTHPSGEGLARERHSQGGLLRSRMPASSWRYQIRPDRTPAGTDSRTAQRHDALRLVEEVLKWLKARL